MPHASDYTPPAMLRNPHLQSVLGSSALRRRRGRLALAAMGAATNAHIVDAGDGVRLQGLHSAIPGHASRGLALLLHGWEGSADSSYMQLTAAHLLARGFDVFRLNFRDHGDTHHLNEGLFHSNRIDEVVAAAAEVSRRYATRPMVIAGYSLGGNFALRVALRAHGGRHPARACRGRVPGAGSGAHDGGDGTRPAAVHVVLRAQMARFAARASASCSRSSTTSTTRCSACACAR